VSLPRGASALAVPAGDDILSVLIGQQRGLVRVAVVGTSDYWPDMALTRHCWKCGTEYKLPGGPGRSETCHTCGSDLKVCLNCVSYDRTVAYQCRDRRADPVAEKHLANYCEYFDMVRREFVPPAEDQSRENEARDALKKLLGD
jgi:hypothetical protein